MEVPGMWVEVAEQTRPFQLYLSWDRGGRASGAVLGRLNFHPLRWGGLKDFALESNAVRFTSESDKCGMNSWTLKAPQHLYKQRGPCCLKLRTEIPALLPCNYLRPCSESQIDDWLPACTNINIPCFCKPRALSSAIPPLTLSGSLAGPSQVRGELLRERVQQLEAQEGRFAESLVSLQFQKAARMAKTLWAYTALLTIQDLLLEELSASETLTKSACTQILESHSPELQELERKLEDQLAHQEAAQLQRALESRQQWAGEGPGLLHEPEEETDSERQVSAVLRRALSKGQKLLEHHQQSLREEQENSELRLASYLSKLTMLPGGTLRWLLSVAVPAALQPELLAVLDPVGQRHQDHPVESDGGGVQADLGRRGKHQGWWQAFESKLRGELISRGLEKMLWAHKRKESILKKTCPPLRERVIFSGKGSWPHLSLESIGELAPVPIVGAETIDLLNTGEKLFIFRNPKEPEISLHLPPRKKKKNFLNAKKATWALGMN
eukprot:bmy_11166T0